LNRAAPALCEANARTATVLAQLAEHVRTEFLSDDLVEVSALNAALRRVEPSAHTRVRAWGALRSVLAGSCVSGFIGPCLLTMTAREVVDLIGRAEQLLRA
jgi:hypothetical protein